MTCVHMCHIDHLLMSFFPSRLLSFSRSLKLFLRDLHHSGDGFRRRWSHLWEQRTAGVHTCSGASALLSGCSDRWVFLFPGTVLLLKWQAFHPVAQDWSLTEAKQGWAWSVPGWVTSWENSVAAGRGTSEASRGCSPCGLCGSWRPIIVMGTLYCQQAPSFGWDSKPRSWLSVVIKNPRTSFEKSRGVTSAYWPNSPLGLWPSWPSNNPHICWLVLPISWCVVGILAHFGCHRIVQVDAAHWWWIRRYPPHNVKHFECLEKS